MVIASSVARRSALLFLGLASPALIVCGCFSGFLAELIFTLLVMAFPAALIVLAVGKKGGLGPLTIPITILTLVLEGCGVSLLVLRGQVLQGQWIGGLPLVAAIQVYGLWLGPLLLVALAYGLTFEAWELRDEDLRRFDRRRAQQGKRNDR